MAIIVVIAICSLVFCCVFWKICKERCELLAIEKQQLAERLHMKEDELIQIRLEETRLKASIEETQKYTQEKLSFIENSKEKLMESFRSMSLESLEKNNQAFITLANATFEKFQEKAEGNFEKKTQTIQEIVSPLKESLFKLGEGMQSLEKERKGDHESLKEQLKHMVEVEKGLRDETATLVRALRAPIVRGRWGEMQLRRVVELCGMMNHCDFFEQAQREEGKIRPDMVIRLPGDKQVIVDAKTPFEAYFDAMQAKSEELRIEQLQNHARHVRQHIVALGKKSYWDHFDHTPEFVVLFLPSESFYSAALEQDPSLIELGIDQKVVIATPMTLIGLLRAIAYGWKQEKLAKHTKEIYELGRELYKRIGDMHEHVVKLGKSLTGGVEAYNKMVGSLESRVLVSAKKFHTLGIGSEEEFVVQAIEHIPKLLTKTLD